MPGRVGRAAFWRFLALNIAVAMAAAWLLPPQYREFHMQLRGLPMPAVPVQPLLAYVLLMPSVWMGAGRLRDTGHAGWQAWLPLLVFAAFTFLLRLMLPVLMSLVMVAEGHRDALKAMPVGIVLVGAAWLTGLLAAAGALRTVFLWLQPGENDVPTAPALTTAPTGLLAGRLDRWPFLALLAGNVALVYGAMFVLDHWPLLKPVAPFRSFISVLLYLPAFIAAVPRLHDRGRSAFLPPIAFLSGMITPFIEPMLDHDQLNWMNMGVNVVTFYLLFLCWQPGDIEANRFGPPPGEAAALPEAPAPVAAAPAPALRSTRAMLKPAPAGPRSFGRRSG